jgi:hypothetical protein
MLQSPFKERSSDALQIDQRANAAAFDDGAHWRETQIEPKAYGLDCSYFVIAT